MDVSHNPWLKLSVLVIFFSLNFNLSLSADRITANQSLSGDQTIISSGGTFKLGFFKPGRRNSEQSEDGTVKFFPSLVARQITEGGDILTLVDPRLGGNADLDELTRLCKVACWCIQDDETQRPSMGQVVQILEGVLTVNLPPIPRSLQVFVDEQEHIIFFTESSSGQSSQSQSQTQSNNSIASSQAKSSTSSITSKS
ncbi:hypothetical protein JCGZ_19752 [Jatropha curcas]|uniref:Uncharacterized protein n=1 Tax=Jatropha curcas TaxID=180498 RepID=A0A067LIY7_JATCU|nr:hypothetical protein JCGZ_19752 [Jatropha curcas]